MKSKNEAIGSSEVDEQYDEFNSSSSIMQQQQQQQQALRSANKSPISDEGIESDAERMSKRGSVSRCWSIDSAALSEEDYGLQMVRRQKTKVTRCCSSDSAVLSDEDQNKGDNESMDGSGRPRYWRTPSVVVSDYSDYSYLDERSERSDLELEKLDTNSSASPSQGSSCSCLDCDEVRDFQDLCRHRRHSDSCWVCPGPQALNISSRHINDGGNRRNSCLASPSPYARLAQQLIEEQPDVESKINASTTTTETTTVVVEYLEPPQRKISDCSTISSLSGDEFEVSELQPPVKRSSSQVSGWRKLRSFVHWTPFFQTYKKQRYPWVQLAGHQGNFRAGPMPGTILKKLCPQEENCFRLLMADVLRPYVPEYKGVLDVRENDVTEERKENDHQNSVPSTPENECPNNNDKSTPPEDSSSSSSKGGGGAVVASYLQLQDLLGEFEQPCVMDCKVGVRTYLESELAKAKERPKLRKDMYEKMVQIDPNAPSDEERRLQGVTKPRYMVWRETISSTATLGFRVEGMKLPRGGSTKDFKTTRTREQVMEAIKRFVEDYPHAPSMYLQRLKAIRATLKASPFFATHEMVGSSLLFVHDAKNAGVWMIDFAKTLPLPQSLPRIHHDTEWQVGNHEDGYLIGVNNLIDIFEEINASLEPVS